MSAAVAEPVEGEPPLDAADGYATDGDGLRTALEVVSLRRALRALIDELAAQDVAIPARVVRLVLEADGPVPTVDAEQRRALLAGVPSLARATETAEERARRLARERKERERLKKRGEPVSSPAPLSVPAVENVTLGHATERDNDRDMSRSDRDNVTLGHAESVTCHAAERDRGVTGRDTPPAPPAGAAALTKSSDSLSETSPLSSSSLSDLLPSSCSPASTSAQNSARARCEDGGDGDSAEGAENAPENSARDSAADAPPEPAAGASKGRKDAATWMLVDRCAKLWKGHTGQRAVFAPPTGTGNRVARNLIYDGCRTALAAAHGALEGAPIQTRVDLVADAWARYIGAGRPWKLWREYATAFVRELAEERARDERRRARAAEAPAAPPARPSPEQVEQARKRLGFDRGRA